MIKAILFDMNGVIINDEHIHERAFQTTVKKHGIDLSHEDYLICCSGKNDKAGYSDIAEKFKVSLPIDDLLKEKYDIYPEIFPMYKKIYEGVGGLIESLFLHYKLAVTSSAPRSEVDLILRDFKMEKYFAVTLSGEDVTKGKPDPEPYILTALALELETNECLVIEDSANGVRSAKSAGCYCIGITTTHSRESLHEADVIVDSFAEINKEMIENIKLKSPDR